MADETKVVVLAGATGNLGGMIARALLDVPGVELRALTRDDTSAPARSLAAIGARVVRADPADRDAVRRATDGAFAVVSALQGGPDVIVDTQLALLDAARAGGVRRFLPSDYSVDFFRLREGENINSDWRRRFANAADAARGSVQVVHVLNGCFLDRNVLFGFLGMFDLAAHEAALWGDGEAMMDFTTYADTARYVAAASTASEVPTRFNVAGDTLDFDGLVRAYTEGSGHVLAVERRGSLADLDTLVEQRRRAEPNNLQAWLPLMYVRAMLGGRGRLEALVNDRFPQIRPTRVVEYVRTMA
jgi:nucleoside-diphosphate-sugar epimerase